ncbi:MAG: nicotinate-nucleotide--dimethylbenzimidazole phosphoribosyltransferase [Pseudomonadota bacterium]
MSDLIATTVSAIEDVDRSAAQAAQLLLDEKTKPRRSLGRLEDLACYLAAIRRTACPPLAVKALVVMAADHGIAEEGISAYPQQVTRQMLLNFSGGGAAINVLARHVGADLVVVDMGVKEPVAAVGVRSCRVGPGTRNFTRGAAMTRDEAVTAVEYGIRLAEGLAKEGATVLGFGDMGIGNSTTASALASVFMGAAPEEVTGGGTGVDEAGVQRKIDVIRRGLAENQPSPHDPLDVLAKVGGFEIGGLCGLVLGGAARKLALVMDGFIASVAALVAVRIAPMAVSYLIASHRSVEPGHRRVLRALEKTPLLELEMRLGEGTGAALAMGIIDASLRILHEMATFARAGVSDSGA